MEPNDQNQKPQQTANNPTNTVPIRVHKNVARTIRRDLEKLNKKELGRRISFSDYVAKALTKLTDADKRELQEATLSNADKLELLFRQKYKGRDGTMSKEQFLGRLLADYAQATADEGAPSTSIEEDGGEGI